METLPSSELAENKKAEEGGGTLKNDPWLPNEVLVKAFEHSVRIQNRVGGIFFSSCAM